MRYLGWVVAAVLCSGCGLDRGAAVWTDTSAAVDVTSFGYWEGSSHYQKARADLSAAQLEALKGLRTIPTPTLVVADAVSWKLSITDVDGGVRIYRAAEFDHLDSDEGSGSASLPTIGMDSLKPFLATFSCLRERGVDVAWPRTLSTDPGCHNLSVLPDCRGAFKFVLAGPDEVWISGSAPVDIRARLSRLDGGLLDDSGEPWRGAFGVSAPLHGGTYALDVECVGSTETVTATIRFAP
jgi:hypothetical protein